MYVVNMLIFVLLTRFSRIFGTLNQIIKFHFALTLCFLDVYMYVYFVNSTA